MKNLYEPLDISLEEELKESKGIIEGMRKQRLEMEKNQFKREKEVEDMKEQTSTKNAKTIPYVRCCPHPRSLTPVRFLRKG